MVMPRLGSAALVVNDRNNDRNEVLLGQRGKEPNFGKWVMPGGKIEPFESIADAARREVWEETGLEVLIEDRLGIFEILNPPEHSVFVLSLARPTGGTLQAGDDIFAVRWVAADLLGTVDLSGPCCDALASLGWL